MLWAVLAVFVVICLYSLSMSCANRGYVVPFWFRRGAQPRDMFAKKFYVVGHVKVLPDALASSLQGKVTVRVFDKLVEDSIVMMAPVPEWSLAQHMRKWEVAVDLAREASRLPILFVGKTTEKIDGVTLGICEIPGVKLAGTEANAAEIIGEILDNISWRINRRKKYRDKGYAPEEIPQILAGCAPGKKHPRCTVLADTIDTAQSLRAAIDSVPDTDGYAPSIICVQEVPNFWGIPDAIYGANYPQPSRRELIESIKPRPKK